MEAEATLGVEVFDVQQLDIALKAGLTSGPGRLSFPGDPDAGKDLKLWQMAFTEVDCDLPMTDDEFKVLHHYRLDGPAPHHNDLVQQDGLFRFQVGFRWYVGRPVTRKRLICWKVSFPPSVSFKDPAALAMMQGASLHFPELRGRIGTEAGGKLMTIARMRPSMS